MLPGDLQDPEVHRRPRAASGCAADPEAGIAPDCAADPGAGIAPDRAADPDPRGGAWSTRKPMSRSPMPRPPLSSTLPVQSSEPPMSVDGLRPWAVTVRTHSACNANGNTGADGTDAAHAEWACFADDRLLCITGCPWKAQSISRPFKYIHVRAFADTIPFVPLVSVAPLVHVS
jgi:hypothetical protein